MIGYGYVPYPHDTMRWLQQQRLCHAQRSAAKRGLVREAREICERRGKCRKGEK